MTDREAERRARRKMHEAQTRAPATLTRDEFLAWRSPRDVQAGPQSLDNPTWHWLIRTKLSAYLGNERFAGPASEKVGPAWSFDRFGMSQTVLPDGRIVYIAGEHEDHYDPDFYIYNDVIVIDPDGTIHIHGYSRSQFAATDFHSATLVGNSILIIGNLGYSADRLVGVTPVYRLSLGNWNIERVITCGASPGWLHEHSAVLDEDGHSIVVSGGTRWQGMQRSMTENIDSWSLNLENGHWTRLTNLNWQQWSMRRTDQKLNRLWALRSASWANENPHHGITYDWQHDEAPNFAALAELYRIDDKAPVPIKAEGRDEYITIVDGLKVRFSEDLRGINVVVEGQLTPERLATLQFRLLETLGRIENAAWEIEPAETDSENGT